MKIKDEAIDKDKDREEKIEKKRQKRKDGDEDEDEDIRKITETKKSKIMLISKLQRNRSER